MISKLFWSFGLAMLAAAAIPSASGIESPAIIPKPAHLEMHPGTFEVTESTAIVTDAASVASGQNLRAILAPATGFTLKLGTPAAGNASVISLQHDPSLDRLGPEGYILDIRPAKVSISAAGSAGIFYGIQTLRQLLPAQIFSAQKVFGQVWTMPCLHIEDTPRFAWRGMMLDVGRHFESKEFVEKFIDVMALHKMNVFHWHLTEDQGWRIEIKKYPKLTEIGSVRAQTVLGRNSGKYDGTPHRGFYTQDEIREVVAFAAARHVTIVPEIEMPGHSVAALAAYPQLACTAGPFKVRESWGVSRDVYCAGNDEVFTFLEDVLTEVIALFPSQFIQIGGDECPKDRWKECPKCQARIKAEGLKDEHELQSYFIRRIEKFLASKGRRLVGWDEILEGGLPRGATVMSWRGEGGGIAAAKSGHDVVMAPNGRTYFDAYQSKDTAHEPLAIGGYLPLRSVYDYEVIPKGLSADEARHVLGGQAQLWTEYIPNAKQVEYMAYPRAAAMAETLWTAPAAKDYADFHQRLAAHLKRLDVLRVNYRPLSPEPVVAGYWKSGQTSTSYQPMSWNLAPLPKAAGSYNIRFQYTGGTHRLDIAWLELLENGNPVARDQHQGVTGARNELNEYTLRLETLKPGATYSLRASVRSDGGTDSNGEIQFSRKP